MDRAEVSLPGRKLVVYTLLHDTQKPGILIGHGLGSRALRHESLINYLYAAGYTVVAPDLTGFGESRYDGLVSFALHQEDFRTATAILEKNSSRTGVFGHSYSGVLAATSGKYDAYALAASPIPMANGQLRSLKKEGAVTRENGSIVKISLNGYTIRTPLAEITNARRWDIKEHSPIVTAPVLLVRAEHDEFVNAEHIGALRSRLQGECTVATIKGAEHKFEGYEHELEVLLKNWFDKHL